MDVAGAAPVQVITRFGFKLASRGPVWDDASDARSAADLRASGVHVINSEGQDQSVLRKAGFRRIKTPSYVAELSLTGTSQDRVAAMKQKWRNTWRRAQNAPITIRKEVYALEKHHWLLMEDVKQQKRKGFRSLPHAILEAYGPVKTPDRLVFTAYHAAVPIAAMVFVTHGCVATYYLGWSNEGGRQHAAHHALLGRAAAHFAKRGIVRLDLGAVDTVNASGLARFKIGTGAHIRPLGGSWLRVPGL